MSLSDLGVLLAYVGFPIVQVGTRLFSTEAPRWWIDIGWGALATCAAIAILITSRVRLDKTLTRRFAIGLAAMAIIFSWKLLDLVFSQQPVQAFAVNFELKPFFYLIAAGLILLRSGPPSREMFYIGGIVLSIIAACDFALESVQAGGLVAPQISGEKNYDACLLVIAFFIAGGESASKLIKLIIFGGVLISTSRTAFAVLILSFVLNPRKDQSLFFRLAGVFFGVLFLFISFWIRNLPTDDLQSMDRFWMLASWWDLISTHPEGFITGFTLGVPVPANVPASLEWLWTQQQEGWGIDGIFPFNYHAFWLRLSISMGLVGVGATLYLLFRWLVRLPKFYFRAFSVLILVEGLTMGLFYLSNVAIPLFFAMAFADKVYPLARKGIAERQQTNQVSAWA